MEGKLESLFFRKFYYIEIGNEQTPEENESQGSIQVKHLKSGFNKEDGTFNGLFSITIASELFVLDTEVHGKVIFPLDNLVNDSNDHITLKDISINSLKLISEETNKRLNEFLKWSPTQLNEFIEFWELN